MDSELRPALVVIHLVKRVGKPYTTCRNAKLPCSLPHVVFTYSGDGFSGLVISMLASGSRVRGFKPGRSRWIFQM
jgi:hypothetical protein